VGVGASLSVQRHDLAKAVAKNMMQQERELPRHAWRAMMPAVNCVIG